MIKDEMEKYRDEDRRQEAGICIVGEARKDREITKPDWHPDGVTFKEKYEKERKLRQEAEGETTIVKGIGMNSPEMKVLKSEVAALKQQLHLNNEEAERTVKNLEIRLAESLEVNESHQKLNGKLQVRLTELEEENKKMHDYINKKIDAYRKSGM